MRDLIVQQAAMLGTPSGGNPFRDNSQQEILDAEGSNDSAEILKQILGSLKKSINIQSDIASSIDRLTAMSSPEDMRESRMLQEKQLTTLESIFDSLHKDASSSLSMGDLNKSLTGLSDSIGSLSSSITTLSAAIGMALLGMRKGLPGLPGGIRGGTPDIETPSKPGKDKAGKGGKGKAAPKPSTASRLGKAGAIGVGVGLLATVASGVMGGEEAEDAEGTAASTTTSNILDTVGTAATVAGVGAVIYGEKKKRDELRKEEAKATEERADTAKKEQKIERKETANKEAAKAPAQPTAGKKPPMKIPGKIGIGGIGGILAGLTLGVAAEKTAEAGHKKTAASLDVASEALSYGSLGATLGSIIPVVGTIAGGAIGATLGAGIGAYKQRDVLFGSTPEETAQPYNPRKPAAVSDKVYDTSAANAAAQRAGVRGQSTPTIITAPTTNIQNTQNINMPQPVRNPDVTYSTYMNRNRVIV